MHIELKHQPGNSIANVTLQQGESCTAQSGVMIAMSSNMDISTTTHTKGRGSLLKAAKRLLAKESIFLNHFEPKSASAEVWLGASLPGDMMVYELDNENLIVQGGSFIACDSAVDIDFSWQGFKALLAGEHVFWVNLKGSGQVLLASFGAIYPVQVDGEYIVDSGHIVAFNETLDFSITKAGKSWIHSYLSGEGFVCKFKGQGTVWCQSHNPGGFGSQLTPTLRYRRG